MGLKRTDEFCKDAVRIALTSGLTRKQVADDLGLTQENDRLRRENRILKEERDILKRPRCSSRAKSREV